MDIAIALFPGFTALDAVGPYEVLSRLPGYLRPTYRVLDSGHVLASGKDLTALYLRSAMAVLGPSLRYVADLPLILIAGPCSLAPAGGLAKKAAIGARS